MNVCYVASVLAYLIDHTFVPLDNIQMTNIYLNLPQLGAAVTLAEVEVSWSLSVLPRMLFCQYPQL